METRIVSINQFSLIDEGEEQRFNTGLLVHFTSKYFGEFSEDTFYVTKYYDKIFLSRFILVVSEFIIFVRFKVAFLFM